MTQLPSDDSGPSEAHPLQTAAAAMFFDTWGSIGRTIAAGILAYAALVVFLRISGKRTLAKMNAFDLVVTVALGSTLSTIVVSRDVPLVDGVVALALLIALQFCVAWTSVRWSAVEGAVKSRPSLLLYRGELRRDQLRRQRVSVEEVRAAARSAGLAGLESLGAVILETDGSFSVLPCDALPGSGLEGVDGEWNLAPPTPRAKRSRMTVAAAPPGIHTG